MKFFILGILLVWTYPSVFKHAENILSFGQRQVMTEGHTKTRNYIKNFLVRNNFNVKFDSFQQNTVIGNITFTNIIASHNKSSNTLQKKVILACHYESKIFKNFQFVGATDAVVPCSFLLEFSEYINEKIQKNQWNVQEIKNFEFIFFDGEEAFKEWSSTDSLYGSRYLANKWRAEDKLKDIDLFVLFDILGHTNPSFFSYNLHEKTKTHETYLKLYSIERELNQSKYFINQLLPWDLDDDHIPFGRYQVPVLHLISNPFSLEWHTKDDDLKHLNQTTILTLDKIFKVFLELIKN